ALGALKPTNFMGAGPTATTVRPCKYPTEESTEAGKSCFQGGISGQYSGQYSQESRLVHANRANTNSGAGSYQSEIAGRARTTKNATSIESLFTTNRLNLPCEDYHDCHKPRELVKIPLLCEEGNYRVLS